MTLKALDAEPSRRSASVMPLLLARCSPPAPAAVRKVSLVQGQTEEVAEPGLEICLRGSEAHEDCDPGA